ncbi:MAG: response regulator transcription factor [Lachnospiraceae bacterium]|nr:response regulator transcription factor [Lachnospiraceae bacterium]
MENYRVGLCDDEKRMLKINNHYMKEIDEEYEEFTLELVNFMAGKDIIEYIKKEPLDIAILDVDMIGMDGMEVAKNLKEVNEDIVVFFITGHSEFAVEAFDVDAIGYVMKPVDKDKLERTLLKAVAKVRELKAKEKQRELVITVSNLKKRIPVDDIIYIERVQTQCVIVTKKEEYRVYDTITDLVEKVGEGFVRASQSFILKVSEISKVTYKEATLKNGMVVSLGRGFTKEVKKAFLEQ